MTAARHGKAADPTIAFPCTRAVTNERPRKEFRVPTAIPLIQSERKLDGLHGLRAVAALAVVLFHLQSRQDLPQAAWLSAVTVNFYLSVHLFFVISAFSLFHSSRYAPARYPAYLVKRFFRIAPLYYVMIPFVIWRMGFPGWGALVSNLTFTFNLVPGYELGMVWAGWSVGVEMIFYLLLPLLLLLLRRPLAFAALYLASAIVSTAVWHLTIGAPGLREDFAYYSIACNLPTFAAGLLFYSVFKRLDATPRRARANGLFAVLVGVLLLLAWCDPLDLHSRATGFYFAFWGMPFGAMCLWQSLYPSRLMRWRAMQWLADRSFSLYLLHPVVIEVLRHGYLFLRRHGLPDNGWLYVACAIAGFFALLVSAEITYRFVELPGIAAGRRIAARFTASRGNFTAKIPVP